MHENHKKAAARRCPATALGAIRVREITLHKWRRQERRNHMRHQGQLQLEICRDENAGAFEVRRRLTDVTSCAKL
jgi:hypothetical protein